MADSSRFSRITVHDPFQLHGGDRHDTSPPQCRQSSGAAGDPRAPPRHAPPRRWLQDRLWRLFATEQAGGNLRQAPNRLRRTLGAHQDIMSCDRHAIAL